MLMILQRVQREPSEQWSSRDAVAVAVYDRLRAARKKIQRLEQVRRQCFIPLVLPPVVWSALTGLVLCQELDQVTANTRSAESDQTRAVRDMQRQFLQAQRRADDAEVQLDAETHRADTASAHVERLRKQLDEIRRKGERFDEVSRHRDELERQLAQSEETRRRVEAMLESAQVGDTEAKRQCALATQQAELLTADKTYLAKEVDQLQDKVRGYICLMVNDDIARCGVMTRFCSAG